MAVLVRVQFPVQKYEVNYSMSMIQACSTLGLHWNTFYKYANQFNCYKPNQGRKGYHKKKTSKIKTQDILDGKYPNYHTYKLKNRILNEQIKEHKCECCGNTMWMDKPIPLELHHKNGDRTDHTLSNLMLLCPNCHAQTNTYRGKNIK